MDEIYYRKCRISKCDGRLMGRISNNHGVSNLSDPNSTGSGKKKSMALYICLKCKMLQIHPKQYTDEKTHKTSDIHKVHLVTTTEVVEGRTCDDCGGNVLKLTSSGWDYSKGRTQKPVVGVPYSEQYPRIQIEEFVCEQCGVVLKEN